MFVTMIICRHLTYIVFKYVKLYVDMAPPAKRSAFELRLEHELILHIPVHSLCDTVTEFVLRLPAQLSQFGRVNRVAEVVSWSVFDELQNIANGSVHPITDDVEHLDVRELLAG